MTASSTNTSLYPLAGIGNVGSYQVSGIPFITGSTFANTEEFAVHFPYVAKAFTVINRSSADIRVHFAPTASGRVIAGHHYITLDDQKDSYTFVNKCTSVYLTLASGSATGSFELHAELTSIPISQMFHLTGAGITS